MYSETIYSNMSKLRKALYVGILILPMCIWYFHGYKMLFSIAKKTTMSTSNDTKTHALTKDGGYREGSREGYLPRHAFSMRLVIAVPFVVPIKKSCEALKESYIFTKSSVVGAAGSIPKQFPMNNCSHNRIKLISSGSYPNNSKIKCWCIARRIDNIRHSTAENPT